MGDSDCKKKKKRKDTDNNDAPKNKKAWKQHAEKGFFATPLDEKHLRNMLDNAKEANTDN